MNFKNEIVEGLGMLSCSPEIILDWEPIADIIADGFPWCGSKIDWEALNFHVGQKIELSETDLRSAAVSFLEANNILSRVSASEKVFYINDSALNFALLTKPDGVLELLDYLVLNVPQHHYFFDDLGRWCLAITSEGYLDFGLSEN